MQDIQPSDIHVRSVSETRIEVDLPDQKTAAVLEKRVHGWWCQLTSKFYEESWPVADDIVSDEIELKIQLSGMFQIAGVKIGNIENSVSLDSV